MKILPINIDDLIHARSVESIRMEFKKTWSVPTLEQVIHSVCAFANDFFNLNGGYIIIGVDEKEGRPILSPEGLKDQNPDRIQKEIRGNCRRIEPEYQPVMSPEIYQERQILVIWVPAGDLRPYQAPEKLRERNSRRAYYVRQGAETVEAKGEILTQLMQMTAKVPFDDRRNMNASPDMISPGLVRNFLSDVKSGLLSSDAVTSDTEIYRSMRILDKANGYEVPKNIALLFFVNDPERFFPGARIEIVQFGDDLGGDLTEEKVFRGPLHLQICQALNFLNAFSTTMIKKVSDRAEAYTTVAFPYEAMEESVVNAVYHRSYENVSEPVKIYLYPDRMEIISYPGPVPGIEREHFQKGRIPPVPYRNRRIGDFLKELRLAEGRGTGIPKIRRKMDENGSPVPVFDFDESRSYFQVVLPAHPQYVVIHSLRESAHLWAVGERRKAVLILETAARRVPGSGALAAQMIDYKAAMGEFAQAENLFREIVSSEQMSGERHLPYIAMAKLFLDKQELRKASEILADIPSPTNADELVELAILYKRSNRLEDAHSVFASNYDLIRDNPKAVHEYAQTKIRLAKQVSKAEMSVKRRLTGDGVELLRRSIQLSDDVIRNAWCWFDLAKSLDWLGSRVTEVEEAYKKAMELLPSEERFTRGYHRWLRRQ
ncbi:MAG: hypothetical protein B6245_09160 [Desulfobacteraceae bacterium 4572_88]|nr:MAG: hypothetical protein B6245_09160 [Desulfobacteraceae bacterium 4572_88]